jgi:glycerol-3-phosphate dehydrogenase
MHIRGGDIGSLADEIATAAQATGDDALATRLVHAHGSMWRDVWSVIGATKDGRDRLGDGAVTVGELRYCVQHEMAETVADLLVRRTHMSFERRDHALEVARAAAQAVAPTLGWDGTRVAREVAAFGAEVDRLFRVDGE